MLVVNQRLPTPDWEANFLPNRYLVVSMLMSFMLKDLRNVLPRVTLFIHSSEFFQPCYVFLFVKCVMDLKQRLIVLQQTK